MEIVISVRAENLLSRIAGIPQNLRASLLIAMKRLAIGVQRAVKEDKLTGQVLNVRTGTLRRSINQEVKEETDGIFAIVGTNVVYAHIHEYGFSGIENVRAHVRRIRRHSTVSKNTGKIVKGKLTGDLAYVSPHQRNVNLPERSFLRSTLREWEPRIRSELKDAALRVFDRK